MTTPTAREIAHAAIRDLAPKHPGWAMTTDKEVIDRLVVAVEQAHAAGMAEGIERAAKCADDVAELQVRRER